MYNIQGREFEHAGRIAPRRDLNRELIELRPQPRYSNPRGLELHQYGRGPFCVFSMAPGWEGKSGVYVFLVDGVPEYVGECEDLGRRMNQGYGNISPRNCYRGGQETNCRINSLILEAAKRGSEILLLFCESEDRRSLEAVLIQKLAPSWNKGRAGPQRTIQGPNRPAGPGTSGSPLSPAASCRDEVVGAARAITAGRAGATFTVQEIVEYLGRNGSTYAEATIRTHVTSRCCANAPNHHAVTYDDFKRVDRGRYQLVR